MIPCKKRVFVLRCHSPTDQSTWVTPSNQDPWCFVWTELRSIVLGKNNILGEVNIVFDSLSDGMELEAVDIEIRIGIAFPKEAVF